MNWIGTFPVSRGVTLRPDSRAVPIRARWRREREIRLVAVVVEKPRVESWATEWAGPVSLGAGLGEVPTPEDVNRRGQGYADYMMT